MSYLTYLKIHHFKSIEDLELKDLSHINIIVGANNSGKTSLLEAMSILGNEDSIKSILNNVSKRSSAYPSSFELFLDIFPRDQDINKSIKIESTIKGLTREVNINGNIVRYIDINNDTDNTFLGNINVKVEDETVIDKNISIEENKDIKYLNDYDIIKIVYVTPYDYYRSDLIESTLENVNDRDKENIIKLIVQNKNNGFFKYVLPCFTGAKKNDKGQYIYPAIGENEFFYYDLTKEVIVLSDEFLDIINQNQSKLKAITIKKYTEYLEKRNPNNKSISEILNYY